MDRVELYGDRVVVIAVWVDDKGVVHGELTREEHALTLPKEIQDALSTLDTELRAWLYAEHFTENPEPGTSAPVQITGLFETFGNEDDESFPQAD